MGSGAGWWVGDDGPSKMDIHIGEALSTAGAARPLSRVYPSSVSHHRRPAARPISESKEPRKAKDRSVHVSQRDKINWVLAIRERDDLTERQKAILTLIEDKHTKIVFLAGPAGSAKSYIGTLAALRLLNCGTQSDLIYVRSIIESASKSIGSLPGTSDEKLQPFVMPLMDKLDELLPKQDIDRLIKESRVVGIPVNFLRGASWNARFILADEAQNLDFKELTTLLTRFGRFSKLVVAGDPGQSDLNGRSGFMKMFNLFNDEASRKEGVHCVFLTKEDVVRSGILRYLLERIEAYVDMKPS